MSILYYQPTGSIIETGIKPSPSIFGIPSGIDSTDEQDKIASALNDIEPS